MRRHRRAAIVAALAAVMVLVAGIVTVVVWPRGETAPPAATRSAAGAKQPPNSGSAQAPPATDVPAETLRSILLTASQITADTGGDPVVLKEDRHDLFDDSATIDARECLGAWAPAQPQVYTQQRPYEGGGSTSVAAQVLRAMNKKVWQDGVMHGVRPVYGTACADAGMSDAVTDDLVGDPPVTVSTALPRPACRTGAHYTTATGSNRKTATRPASASNSSEVPSRTIPERFAKVTPTGTSAG